MMNKMLLLTITFFARRHVGMVLHLYQKSIELAQAKALSKEDRIEAQQLLQSQEQMVLSQLPLFLGDQVKTSQIGSSITIERMDKRQRDDLEDFIYEVKHKIHSDLTMTRSRRP